jgi:methionyl-tRNA formyltransferase
VKPKLLLFGALGPYAAAFTRTIAPHTELVACVIRRPIESAIDVWLRHRIAVLEEPGFACPIWTVGAYADPKFYARLQKVHADLIVVVGFPKKLPAKLVNGAARLGAVNLHPGLLPNDRGPCPVFWAIRRGDEHVGVTLHQLSDDVDRGDMLYLAKIPAPFAGTGAALSERLGVVGGELLVANLRALVEEPWHLVPQPSDSNAWARKPKGEDLQVIADEWTARRLFHFVRGARAFGTPWARLADDVYYFADASAFDPGRNVPGEFVVLGDNLILKVTDGTVTLRLARV